MKNFWKSKKVVITGAAGFVGSHMVKELVARGAKVTAAISTRTTNKKTKKLFGNLMRKITFKKVDLLNFNDCLKITKKQDVVLNFAAMDGGLQFKEKYAAQIFKTNTEIVLHMLEASARNKVDRFLLMSSTDIYPKKFSRSIRENQTRETIFTEEANGYIWSKRFSEIAAKMYQKEYGMKIAIARPSNIYGPGDETGIQKERVIPTFIQKVQVKEKIKFFQGGIQKKQFLYIDDLVTALLDLVEKYAVGDPINLAGNNAVTIKELAEIINNIIYNKKIKRNKRKIKKLPFDISLAKKHIHFKPKIDLYTGLENTYNFYKNIK